MSVISATVLYSLVLLAFYFYSQLPPLLTSSETFEKNIIEMKSIVDKPLVLNVSNKNVQKMPANPNFENESKN